MSFDEEVRERGVQRAKHLEDPNYRRLSDVFTMSSEQHSDYVSRIDISMLACYLSGNDNTHRADVKEYIERNLNNPEINWRGLFAYLDERDACQYRIQSAIIKNEFIIVYNVLNPYRDKVCPESTFVGF